MMTEFEKWPPHLALQRMQEVGGWELSSAMTSAPSLGRVFLVDNVRLLEDLHDGLGACWWL